MQRTFKVNSRKLRSPAKITKPIHSLSGTKFSPSDEPPVLSGQPWNSITIDTDLTISAGAWSYFTVDSLYTALLNQAGFNGSTVQFEARLTSVALWANVETEKNTCARICVMPFDPDNTVELTRLESNMMRNKYAKVGYVFPLTISSHPITLKASDSRVIVAAQASVSCKGIIHFKLLWRGAKTGFKSSSLKIKYVPFVHPLKDTSQSLEELTLASSRESLASDDSKKELEGTTGRVTRETSHTATTAKKKGLFG